MEDDDVPGPLIVCCDADRTFVDAACGTRERLLEETSLRTATPLTDRVGVFFFDIVFMPLRDQACSTLFEDIF